MQKSFINTLSLLLLLPLFFVSQANAQEEYPVEEPTTQWSRHEARVNVLRSILGLHPEFAYEYSLNHDISIGSKLGFSLNPDENDLQLDGVFQLKPYVRWNFYRGQRTFGNSIQAFYVEVNTFYTQYKQIVKEEMEFEGGPVFGLGVGTGYKYISPRDWVFESGFTLGRNLNLKGARKYNIGYSISIGKRF